MVSQLFMPRRSPITSDLNLRYMHARASYVLHELHQGSAHVNCGWRDVDALPKDPEKLRTCDFQVWQLGLRPHCYIIRLRCGSGRYQNFRCRGYRYNASPQTVSLEHRGAACGHLGVDHAFYRRRDLPIFAVHGLSERTTVQTSSILLVVQRKISYTTCLKKNLNAPRPSEHPPVRGKKCQNV